MISQNTKKLIYSLATFLLLGLGISLQVKAGIGQSMFNAFSLILADLFHLELGTMLNIINLMLLFINLLIKRSLVKRQDLLQLAATILSGYIVNFYLYTVLDQLIVQAYIMKLMLFTVGLVLASFSLGAILAMEIIQFPLESLCIQLGQKLSHKMSTIRMRFDIFFAISTVILAFTTNHGLQLREGTIISFFLLSRLIGFSYYFIKNKIGSSNFVKK